MYIRRIKEVCHIDIVATTKTVVMEFSTSFRPLDHLSSLEKGF